MTCLIIFLLALMELATGVVIGITWCDRKHEEIEEAGRNERKRKFVMYTFKRRGQ